MGIIYTLAFGGAVIGIASVVFWCVRNDSREAGRPTTGWFAMRENETENTTTGQEMRRARRNGRRLSRPMRNA